MGPSLASLASAFAVAIAITCSGAQDMNGANQPSWIASTLRVRSHYAGSIANSKVSWSDPDKVQVHVQLDAGKNHCETQYSWKVDKTETIRAQTVLSKLRAKKRDAKGAIALSVGDGAQSDAADPAEADARDVLIRASHLRYAEALTAHTKAKELVARDPQHAIELERVGVAALSDLYESPDLIDDTQMKLIMADDAFDKGQRAEALALLQGVLDSRLSAYRALRVPTATLER
jgi:hypothetical protein